MGRSWTMMFGDGRQGDGSGKGSGEYHDTPDLPGELDGTDDATNAASATSATNPGAWRRETDYDVLLIVEHIGGEDDITPATDVFNVSAMLRRYHDTVPTEIYELLWTLIGLTGACVSYYRAREDGVRVLHTDGDPAVYRRAQEANTGQQ